MRRQDISRFSVVFISPNGIHWSVYIESEYVQWLQWAIRGIAREEDYVHSRRTKPGRETGYITSCT